MRLDGTTAMVTGASSGIGLETARLLAARGANVALIARDPGRLEAARSLVEADRRDGWRSVIAVPCDVSSYDAVEAAHARIVQELGPVDALFACAGYCTPMRFTELPIAEFRSHVDVNLLGVTYAARVVAPGMIERGRGHIAMVSSMGGFIGVYGYSAYSPAKFGVMGLAEVLRCELKPHGIGVTVLCPPNVDTPGYAREREIEPAETAAINGSVKAASPRDMAEVLVAAAERGRYLVIPGATNALLYRLKGLAPELLFAVFDRQVAAVRARRAGDGER